MAGIDASIALNANRPVTQPYNPLQQYAQVAQTGNSLIGLQNNAAQLAARRGYTEDLAGVPIDPKTGLPDQTTLLGNLAHDPRTAWMLPQFIQASQEAQKRQLDIGKSQNDLTTAQTNTFNTALNPLVRMGSNVSPQDVFSTLSGLHAAGFNTDAAVNDAAVTMPARQPGQSDAQYGQQLQGWIVNHAARAWPAAVAADKFAPNVATVDTGGNIITRDTNPYTNPGITSAAPIGKTLSPGEQTSQVPGPLGPQGQKTVITQGAYAAQNGMGNLIPGGAPGQASPFANGGRLPSALLNPNRPPDQSGGSPAAPPAPGPAPSGTTQSPAQGNLPAPFSLPPSMASGGAPQGAALVGSVGAGSPGYAPATPAAATGPAPGTPAYSTHADERFPPPGSTVQQSAQQPSVTAPGQAAPTAYGQPMTVSMGPAQQAAAEGLGRQGQDASGALFAAAQDSPQRQAQLNAMLGDLTKYGSGPNSAALSYARGRLVQLGVDPGGWAEGQSAQENFTKMANQFLAKQAGSMGPVTNDKLALAAESGPNPMFTTLGNQGVLHIAQGNEDALTAKANAWAQAQLPQQQGGQGLTGADYQGWSSQFNQGFMPSAFWYARMAPAERQTLIAGMDPTTQRQLHGAIVNGVNKGWIDPTSLMPTASSVAPPASAAAAVAAAAPSLAATPTVPAAVPQSSPTVAPSQAAVVSPLLQTGFGQPAVVGGY